MLKQYFDFGKIWDLLHYISMYSNLVAFCTHTEKKAFYALELFGKISGHTSAINPFLNSK